MNTKLLNLQKQEDIRRSTDILAKLLAIENLTIIDGGCDTSYIDIRNRIVHIVKFHADSPLSNKSVRITSIAHEVGHALFTPLTLLHSNVNDKYPNLAQFINIVEDIRIERLIKNRYSGIHKTMKAGRLIMFENGFYGQKALNDPNSIEFANKVILYTKVGKENSGLILDNRDECVIKYLELNAKDEASVVKCAKFLYLYCGYREDNPPTKDDFNTDDLEGELSMGESEELSSEADGEKSEDESSEKSNGDKSEDDSNDESNSDKTKDNADSDDQDKDQDKELENGDSSKSEDDTSENEGDSDKGDGDTDDSNEPNDNSEGSGSSEDDSEEEPNNEQGNSDSDDLGSSGENEEESKVESAKKGKPSKVSNSDLMKAISKMADELSDDDVDASILKNNLEELLAAKLKKHIDTKNVTTTVKKDTYSNDIIDEYVPSCKIRRI